MSTIGQNHICTYGVYTVFLVEKLPNIRSYTVHIYGSYVGLAKTTNVYGVYTVILAGKLPEGVNWGNV